MRLAGVVGIGSVVLLAWLGLCPSGHAAQSDCEGRLQAAQGYYNNNLFADALNVVDAMDADCPGGIRGKALELRNRIETKRRCGGLADNALREEGFGRDAVCKALTIFENSNCVSDPRISQLKSRMGSCQPPKALLPKPFKGITEQKTRNIPEQKIKPVAIPDPPPVMEPLPQAPDLFGQYYAEAMGYFERKEYYLARQRVENALRFKPEDAQTQSLLDQIRVRIASERKRISSAILLFYNGRYEESRQALEDMASSYELSPPAAALGEFYQGANCMTQFLLKGKEGEKDARLRDDASAHFRQSIQIDPKFKPPRERLSERVLRQFESITLDRKP